MKIINYLISLFILLISTEVFSTTYIPNDIYSEEKLKNIEQRFISKTRILSDEIQKVFATDNENFVLFKFYSENARKYGSNYITYFQNLDIISLNSQSRLLQYKNSNATPEVVGNDIIQTENLNSLEQYLNSSEGHQNKTIDYVSDNEKAVIYVFTDTTCPYCERYFNEVSDFQNNNISVRHIPYPRTYDYRTDYENQGTGFNELSNVLCSEDPNLQLENYFMDSVSSSTDITTACQEQVEKGYLLGEEVGVTGTPATLLPNGELLPGARSAMSNINGQTLVDYILSSIE